MTQSQIRDFTELLDPNESRIQVIPVWREISADLDTPVSAFLKAAEGDYAFLLESAEGGEKWGRYSFIGMDPEFVLRANGEQCEFIRQGHLERKERRADPLEFVREHFAHYVERRLPKLPRFIGGAVGFIGYDAVRFWHKVPEVRGVKSSIPTLVFAAPRTLLAFDNLKNRVLIMRLVFHKAGSEATSAYSEAATRIEQVVKRLRGPIPNSPPRATAKPGMQDLGSQAAYEDAVRKIKEYIRAGDCIQVVPSHRFQLAYDGPAFDFYRALRAVNPSPYMFYLNYPELNVIGASPETLIRVENGEMLVAPIAGSRKRGESDEQDRVLERDLLADPKERAEHVMLVDLARNDLGRVAKAGSVRVDNFMHVQRYSHVMHIVSEVRARLADGKTAFDAVRSAFPAGTLSGAPKVRAMQIIDEMEPHSRDLYGGAVGYFGFSGNTDLCIAIRTAWRQGSEWYLQVGAGIVADSDPPTEYEETLTKAGALFRALEVARSEL